MNYSVILFNYSEQTAIATWVYACATFCIFLATVFAVLAARKFWFQQRIIETKHFVHNEQYKVKTDALKAVWALLKFMTAETNGCNLIQSERVDDKVVNFLIIANYQAFQKSLNHLFFDNGHGLFLSTAVKDNIFAYRRSIYKIIDAQRAGGKLILPEKIKINNMDKPQELINIYRRLKELLTSEIFELNKISKQFPTE